MARLSEARKAVIIVVLLGAALAGIAFISFFRWKDNYNIEQQKAHVELEIERLKERIVQISLLEAKKRDVIEALEDMTKILPNKGDLQQDAFLKLLQERAADTGVRVRSLACEADKGTAEKRFARFRYKVILEGNYPEFVNFLNQIETHKRFLKIDSIEMPNKQTGSDIFPDPVKEIKLTISTYTYTATPE